MNISSRAQAVTINARKNQSGMLLIEALFAILVFSLGVLALIGFQASAIRASSESRSRSDATLIADQILSEIWTGVPSSTLTSPPTPITSATLNTFVANNLVAWKNAAKILLPQSAVANPVVVSISNGVSDGTNVTQIVDVTIKWQAPGDPFQHQLAVSTQIN